MGGICVGCGRKTAHTQNEEPFCRWCSGSTLAKLLGVSATTPYVADGMRVLARRPADDGWGDDPLAPDPWVPVTVVTAMGNTARCTNPELGIDTWYDVDELRALPQEKTDVDG